MLPNQPALLDETDRKLYTLLALRELGVLHAYAAFVFHV